MSLLTANIPNSGTVTSHRGSQPLHPNVQMCGWSFCEQVSLDTTFFLPFSPG